LGDDRLYSHSLGFSIFLTVLSQHIHFYSVFLCYMQPVMSFMFGVPDSMNAISLFSLSDLIMIAGIIHSLVAGLVLALFSGLVAG
jgi:hypothetical protein